MTTKDHDAEANVARLLAELDARQAGGEDLDANDVARLSAGSTPEDVRAALAARMTDADTAVIGAITSEAQQRGAQQRGAPARPRRGVPRWMPAMAAALVVGVGLWFLLTDPPAPPRGDAELRAAFDTLRSAHPDAFGDVRPVLEPERLGAAALLRRGGIRILRPRAGILGTTPTLDWVALRGADLYAVEVLSDEGERALETEVARPPLPWPTDVAPLDEGTSYVVRVHTVVAGVAVEGSGAFHVVDEAVATRYRRALAAIDASSVAPELRPVVSAHVALRLDLLVEALDHVRGETSAAADELTSQTRTYLERRLGLR